MFRLLFTNNSFIKYCRTQLVHTRGYILYKRASLACAVRQADTSCPPEAPFGRLEVTLVNYKGDIISKYVHLSFKIDITRKNTKFVNFKFLMRNDDVITK